MSLRFHFGRLEGMNTSPRTNAQFPAGASSNGPQQPVINQPSSAYFPPNGPQFAPAPAPISQPVVTQPSAPMNPPVSGEQIVGRILAGAGGLITLIGFVLLLVMVAKEGLLTPEVRVFGGAALAGGLAVAAEFVRRREGGRLGSVAMFGTAAAGLFFDVVAVTRIYHWLDTTAGLALALLVAGAAAVRAVMWDEKWLYLALCVGVGALAPFLTQEASLLLVGFMLVIQAAGSVPEFTKGWDDVSLARTAPAMLAGFALVERHWAETSTLIAVALIAIIGVATALAVGLRSQHRALAAWSLGGAHLPVILLAYFEGNAMRGGIGAGLLVVAMSIFLVLKTLDAPIRAAFAALAAVGAALVAIAFADGDLRAVVWFAIAAALFAIEAVQKSPQRYLGLAGTAFAVFGVAVNMTVLSGMSLFYRGMVADASLSQAFVGLLAFGVGSLGLLTARGNTPTFSRQTIAFGSGSVALYGLISAVIVGMGQNRDFFFTAHLFVTLIVLTVAASILLLGLKKPAHLGASMAWGLTLFALAMAKLFLFDLQYMSLIVKALTFILAGLLLLAAGTRYAQLFAKVRRERVAQELADVPVRIRQEGAQDDQGKNPMMKTAPLEPQAASAGGGDQHMAQRWDANQQRQQNNPWAPPQQ